MNAEEAAKKIKSMEIRGAGKIAKTASSALAEEAENYVGNDAEKFLSHLGNCRKKLLASRPTAVSLHNGIFLTLKGIEKYGTVSEIRKKVVSNSKKFAKDSEKALEKISVYGSGLISDGDVILTHCNSQAALSVIIKASKKKKIKVYATESRPWGQGFLTAAQLAEAGVDVTLIIDSCVNTVMDEVDKVFVGADTLTVNGNLYNKIGTSQIASIAKSKKKKFYVCCETYKISPVFRDREIVIEERGSEEVLGGRKLPKNAKIFNPVFDCTESKFIESVITEDGILKTGEIRKKSVEKFGKEEFE